MLAGAPRVRIGIRTARGVLEYRSRDERPLTPVLPSSPAAVRVYGPDGCCSALCLDLDVARGGPEAVARDGARLTAWLHDRGARVVTDRSPSGGIHIYLPLAQRLPYEQAREIVEALAATHPTLDAGPHRSLKTGCIRPPGAAHKSGGHQQLTTPLATAYDVLRRRNSPAVLGAIHVALRADITAWQALRAATSDLEPEVAAGAATRGALSPRLRAIAETGEWDRSRYASPSEARQAVIAGAAGAGWQLADVAVRLADGRWPGLAALYARYSPAGRRSSLARDWHSARAYLTDAQRAGAAEGDSHARKSHTSPPRTHGGTPVGETPDDHDHIRSWRTLLRAVEVHRFPGRAGYLTRFVLRALGEAAHKIGSRYVAFGTRSLAVATGADHSSVAAVLRRLAGQPEGWIDLIEPAHGEHADLYALTIPPDLAGMAADLRFDTGQAHALRPVFRELGHIAALVFETIETRRATTITTLVPATGVSRTAVSAAVDVLLAHRLVDRSPTGLTARTDRLRVVAELLGALEAVATQMRRHARERALWRAYLARHEPDPVQLEPTEDYWWPPDDIDSSLTAAMLAA